MEVSGVVIIGGAHGALALARSLGARDVRVIYLTHDTPLPSWSRFVDETVRWSGPSDAGALAFLMEAARSRRWEGYLLVAAGDLEVRLVSQHRAALSTHYQVVLPDWGSLCWVCEKPLLYQRADELGVRVPLTYKLASIEQAKSLRPTFPVVLKPNMGGGNNSFSKAKVVRADDSAALVAALGDAIAQVGAENVVVQEMIPGGGESQFSYVALWNKGEPVAEFTARRARQYPVDFGYTSTFVEVVDAPEASEAARATLRSIGFCGLVEVEFKRDGRDNSLKLLDVNPRPWSWFGLCASAGVDLGAMLLDVARGRPVDQPPRPRQGAAWSYLVRDMIGGVRLAMRGDIGVSDYVRSLGKVRSWATFAWNDPRPGLIDLPLTAWRVLTRRVLGWS